MNVKLDFSGIPPEKHLDIFTVLLEVQSIVKKAGFGLETIVPDLGSVGQTANRAAQSSVLQAQVESMLTPSALLVTPQIAPDEADLAQLAKSKAELLKQAIVSGYLNSSIAKLQVCSAWLDFQAHVAVFCRMQHDEFGKLPDEVRRQWLTDAIAMAENDIPTMHRM